MCTVTFIPAGHGVYHLTSNRDEHTGRARALPPRRHEDIVYPTDPVAGGSWVALKRDKDAGVLLNGAFAKHRRQEVYRKSRGLVFLEIIHAAAPLDHFGRMDLKDIEPFTLILFINNVLLECRWDGEQRYIRELETSRPHIWSSVTLYDEAAHAHRKEMLVKWYSRENVSTDSVLDLHRQMGIEGDAVATVSITTLRMGGRKARLRYVDLRERPARSANAFLIRLRNWEYWPFYVVHAPMFFYWAWLSLKARSFFFFSTANPTIANSGFLLESKQQIYDLMPPGVYPKTLYFRKGTRIGEIRHRLAEQGFSYPLMAKPDIGQRGMGVELLKDDCGLLLYALRSKVDFLLQEYVNYPVEIGVFYYRMPGEQKGTITGVVGKEFLTVTGDGVSTTEALLLRDERYVLQLPALRRTAGRRLKMAPAKGEVLELAPYGNHSRGAKFLDHSHRVTPRIEAVIDELCRRIPGFYFGRLDIRCQSWSQLEAGEAFSVIELNGAGSEPTHIYDPRHSLFFAWKEIKRHLDILYKVSRANLVEGGLAPMSFGQGLKMLRDYRRHEKLIAS
ncbi:MAG TPA: NRDE family protein [Puia sp.]|nr:NRDE family protein [Puia sp.]